MMITTTSDRVGFRMNRLLAGAVVLIAILAVFATWVAWASVRDDASTKTGTVVPPAATPQVIQHGEYLARAGNCAGCHTARGGAAYAGGRPIDTPYGQVFASNLTPDVQTGLGVWSSDDFWRALHNGRSRDGRLLSPAFPYTSFTRLTRADSDALFAYLRTIEPVSLANAPHALRFPYGSQAALAIWRALYFRPGQFEADPHQDADWNRGKYLVSTLGHCAGCHSSRNLMGATSPDATFDGGVMPDAAWYAPSLRDPHEAGVQDWSRDQAVALLRDGTSGDAVASGPMAEVVRTSTQYLTDPDLQAMAAYLQSLPPSKRSALASTPARAATADLRSGEAIYRRHCAACHGDEGQGVATIYPALTGNRTVLMASPNNLVQIIRHGGFAASTPANPRPFGMPPFGQLLSDDEITAVSNFVRQAWGNAAPPVSYPEVVRIR